MSTSKNKLFYGWIIVALGILIMGTTVGLVNNCLSLYIVSVCDELSFSRKAGGMIVTLYSIGNMLSAAFSAKLYHLFPVKRIMQVSSVVLAGVYFCYSLAHRLWVFYLISIIAAFALWMLAYIPFAVILNNWFHKRGGFVIGLTYMGTGIGGMVYSRIVGQLIYRLGWRSTVVIMALVIVAIVIPCVFLLKDDPDEMGLKPYGYEPEGRGQEAAQHEGMLLSEVVKTGRFIMLAISIAVLNLVNTGFASTFASYMSDIGYPITTASAIVSAEMAALAIGKMLLGWLYDRLGYRAATAISGLFLVMTVAASLFMPGSGAVTLVILGFSIGFAFGSVGVPVISRAIFGMRDFSSINGAFLTISGIVSACGPVFCGYIYDISGSYSGSYKLYVIMGIIATLMMVKSLSSEKTKKQA